MKLDLKKVCSYLPYELYIYVESDGFLQNDEILKVTSANSEGVQVVTKSFPFSCNYSYDDIKLVLKPLIGLEDYFEDLYGMLEHQDVTDYFDADFLCCMDDICVEDLEFIKIEHIPYGTLEVLLKHHFDVFGLIPEGLAVDINTIKN